MDRRRWIMVGVVAALAVVAFLLFRPDTLFTEVEAGESLEEAFATTTEAEAATTTNATPTTIADTTLATTMTTVPVEPVQLSSGEFVGIDHSATGTASVYEQDGRYVLRFEDDTDIQNGPDLYVWILPTTSYQGGTPTEFIDLGFLQGTIGGQNYDLTDDFDPEVHRTVLIWCLRFAVPFATAPLS
ncbi:MAG TPA: DM13 domain-containing protein [Acidimicrobiia bacterium]|nr:DM13 domain-containing protein [Acidimicrobiia bacterium]